RTRGAVRTRARGARRVAARSGGDRPRGADARGAGGARIDRMTGELAKSRGAPHAVIFGGAGFIGCNLAQRLLRESRRVLVFDSLARGKVERNLRWLK